MTEDQMTVYRATQRKTIGPPDSGERKSFSEALERLTKDEVIEVLCDAVFSGRGGSSAVRAMAMRLTTIQVAERNER